MNLMRWLTSTPSKAEVLEQEIEELKVELDWERKQTNRDADTIAKLSKIIGDLKEALGIDYEQEQKKEFFDAMEAFHKAENDRRHAAKERLDQAYQLWFSTVMRGSNQ